MTTARVVGRVRQRLRDNIEHGRSYALVLGLVLVMYFATGIVQGYGTGHLALVILQGAVLLFAFRVSNASRRLVRLGFILWGVMMAIAVAAILSDATPEASVLVEGASRGVGIARFASAALLAFAIGVIGTNLARRDRVDSETLLGVITIYLLIGMFFTFLTLGLEAFMSGPYFIEATSAVGNGVKQAADVEEFLFFSFVTLTTVGYGNLVPATDLGQTLASFEAICGTLFLILAIGRTVSVADAEKRSQEERELRETIRDETKKELAYLHERLDALGTPRPPPSDGGDNDGEGDGEGDGEPGSL